MTKECKVVMLPTETVACANQLLVSVTGNNLFILVQDDRENSTDGWFALSNNPDTCNIYLPDLSLFKPQHLYITSDEHVATYDWFFMYGPYKCRKSIDGLLYYGDGKKDVFGYDAMYPKILATTDPALNLPKIPKEFIENYAKAGGIGTIQIGKTDGGWTTTVENGYIVIADPEAKTYTGSAVIDLFIGFCNASGTPITTKQMSWLNNNIK